MKIKLSMYGAKGFHFFTEGLNFLILIGTYSDQEEYQASCLEHNYQNRHFNSEQIAKWCISHHIQYQFLYPIEKRSIIKNPYKYFKFLQLKRKINMI